MPISDFMFSFHYYHQYNYYFTFSFYLILTAFTTFAISVCYIVCFLFRLLTYGCVWLNSLVVSALGIRTWGPGFDSRMVPLFHWVAILDRLLTHNAFPVSQLQETGMQKGVFRA